MKILKLYCFNCKKEMEIEVTEPVVAVAYKCVKCNSPVYDRGIVEKDEVKKQ